MRAAADGPEQQIETQLRAAFPDCRGLSFEGRSTIVFEDKDEQERRLFYKVGTGGSSADLSLLQYEAEGLSRLEAASGGLLAVPKPWLTGEVTRGPACGGVSGFIVMDELEMGGRRGAEAQRALGKGLAAVHGAPPGEGWPTGRFGFPMDGCCGALAQPNNPGAAEMTWVEFWARHRLGFQLEQCRSCAPIQEAGSKLLPKLGALFEGLEDVQPSLLHGDLWSGNHGVAADGRPCLYAPACYYGHDEADFGIANMFGGLSSDFYEAYFEERPKKQGFEDRALLYELHHHLNHMNIFGGSYQHGALSLMNRLLKVVGR